MSHYQIADLEQLSGIKAHTIRIWEKRYNLISPSRTSSNIRYYTDDDVIKLLNTVSLLDAGYKISRIGLLSDSELKEQIHLINTDEGNYTLFINKFIDATLHFNIELFNATFDEIYFKIGMQKTMTEVIYPFLIKIGILWTTSDTSPIQEHFASSMIRKKIVFSTETLPKSLKSNVKFVLFLPEEEWHDIGLLFTEYLIAEKGLQVYNLGQNLPIDNLPLIVEAIKPDYVYSFFITRKTKQQLNDTIKKILSIDSSFKLLISGTSSNTKQINTSDKRISILYTPTDLELLIHKQFGNIHIV
jgi:MerR family transcriptional regulator, light-induced transcriptional regulator